MLYYIIMLFVSGKKYEIFNINMEWKNIKPVYNNIIHKTIYNKFVIIYNKFIYQQYEMWKV